MTLNGHYALGYASNAFFGAYHENLEEDNL